MTTLLIPRVMHWIWLGPTALPDEHRRYIAGWIERHPRWDTVVWDDEMLPPLRNQEQYDRAGSPAQRADIARYEILHRHGGVYLDTDMECRGSIERVLDNVSAFAARETSTRIGNAVLGASVGHPWLASLIDRLPAAMASGRDTLHQTGPAFLTAVTTDRSDVTVFDAHLFYPYSPKHRANPPAVPPDAIAVHHWAGSWWEADRRSHDPLRDRAVAALDAVVPSDAVLVLVDSDLGLDGLRCRTLPFLERDGRPHGTPRDDAEAIRELARMREAGARHVAFIAPAFWWFENYAAFDAYLRSNARTLLDDDDVVLFELP